MAKQLKSTKSSKSDKALSLLEPESAPLATMPESSKAIEPAAAPAQAVKEVPDGYTNFVAYDEQAGMVFTTCQAQTRGYVSALVCESPLGLIVARWSRDHKGLLREAKRIRAGMGTAGLAAPRVVDVQATDAAPENAISRPRVREAEYYALMSMTGPNHEKREQAKLARAAAAQAAGNVQGPVQQLE